MAGVISDSRIPQRSWRPANTLGAQSSARGQSLSMSRNKKCLVACLRGLLQTLRVFGRELPVIRFWILNCSNLLVNMKPFDARHYGRAPCEPYTDEVDLVGCGCCVSPCSASSSARANARLEDAGAFGGVACIAALARLVSLQINRLRPPVQSLFFRFSKNGDVRFSTSGQCQLVHVGGFAPACVPGAVGE